MSELKCILCGMEKTDGVSIPLSDNFEMFLCTDCMEYLENGGKIARVDNYVTQYGERLQNAITAWLAYKAGRNEDYNERGLESLKTRIKRQVKAIGEDAVAMKIEMSMAKNWRGIAWDVGTIPDEEILNMFNHIFALSPKKDSKEIALRKFKLLFRKLDNSEDAKVRGRKIYMSYKAYLESLSDEKYCKRFDRWLTDEIPSEWWK